MHCVLCPEHSDMDNSDLLERVVGRRTTEGRSTELALEAALIGAISIDWDKNKET